MAESYADVCRGMACRMSALMKRAERRDTPAEVWTELDKLKEFVDVVVEEVPQLDDHFRRWEELVDEFPAV